MKKKGAILLLLLCFCMQIVLAQAKEDFAKDNNKFGLNIYQLWTEKNIDNDNFIFSPLSLSNVLSMAYWGAKNKTATQFEQVFNFQNTPKFHKNYALFSQSLVRDTEITQTKIANAIWLDKQFRIQQTYQDILVNSFANKVQLVDFKNDIIETEKQINQWAKEQTKEKITVLIPPNSLSNLTRLVITNTLYFNAKWLSPFEEQNTKDGVFFTKQKEVKTAFMNQKSEIFYWQAENFESIVLPFSDMQYMTFVMPKSNLSLQNLEQQLTPDFYQSNFMFSIDDLLIEKTNFESQEIHLSLPRFKMDITLPIKSLLINLGLKYAFDVEENADFSGITASNFLRIDEIFHKTFLDVNEEGVEAASATAVVFDERGGASVKEVKFNRPFLFFICDGYSGTILFQGRFVNPEKQ
jgi:serpin B